ncbi:MAG: hypothetical protein H0V14_03500 [Chitinophagaceae bacterium]|nr:hypothetical protein [Chitinophagaceae bacterium]
MNLQKHLRTVLIVLCISLSLPAVSTAISPGTELSTGPGKNPNNTINPLARLQEIKDMDKENLSRAEKKDLRKEVKKIKKELKRANQGVYLSVGAIIIIVLLLILLL